MGYPSAALPPGAIKNEGAGEVSGNAPEQPRPNACGDVGLWLACANSTAPAFSAAILIARPVHPKPGAAERETLNRNRNPVQLMGTELRAKPPFLNRPARELNPHETRWRQCLMALPSGDNFSAGLLVLRACSGVFCPVLCLIWR